MLFHRCSKCENVIVVYWCCFKLKKKYAFIHFYATYFVLAIKNGATSISTCWQFFLLLVVVEMNVVAACKRIRFMEFINVVASNATLYRLIGTYCGRETHTHANTIATLA